MSPPVQMHMRRARALVRAPAPTAHNLVAPIANFGADDATPAADTTETSSLTLGGAVLLANLAILAGWFFFMYSMYNSHESMIATRKTAAQIADVVKIRCIAECLFAADVLFPLLRVVFFPQESPVSSFMQTILRLTFLFALLVSPLFATKPGLGSNSLMCEQLCLLSWWRDSQ